MSAAMYERIARHLMFWIVAAGLACCLAASAGCEDESGRKAAHRLEVENGFEWRGCKTLTGKYTSGSVCISADGKTLAICDEDGCIVYQPTATMERP